MSVTYCLLILSFLCFSLHACNARPLASIEGVMKKDENTGFDKVSREINTRKVLEDSSINKTQKPKDATKKMVKAEEGSVETSSGGSVQSESLVSVSWRVPHKKRRDKHPGFNLDYSPPKTHPPSHN